MAIAAPSAPISVAALTDEQAGELVTEYARRVIDGRIVTGRLVRLACERHLEDLVTGAARGIRFDAALAGRAIRFYPMVFRHYKGEWGPIPGLRPDGLPVELELWQCFIVGAIFGWQRKLPSGDWVRRFRKAFVEVAKKNGKTLLFAGIGIILGFFDGEPGAEVYSAATKKDQARLLWGDGAQLVKRSPALNRRLRTTVGAIFDLETASFFKPISSEEKGEEGINPHAVLVDEVHRHRTRDLLDMLSQSFGARRQPFLGEITTAGDEGESIWQEEHDLAVSVLERTLENDALFAYVAMLDKGDDPFDEEVWPKANPNLTVSVKIDDLRTKAIEARAAPGQLPSFLRLRMNVRHSAAARAIDLTAWDLGAVGFEVEEGAEAWGGLDLGWSRDLSAFALWVPDGEGYYELHPFIFCPEESPAYLDARGRIPYQQWADEGLLILTEGNVRDDDAIERKITELGGAWSIREIRYDRAMSTNLVNRLNAAGFVLEPQAQHYTGIGPAWKEFEKLYMAGRIRHAGHRVLRWMASNLQLKEDDNGNARPVKPNRNSPLRIDGLSASLDAIAGWLATEPAEDGSSVWDEEGRSLTI